MHNSTRFLFPPIFVAALVLAACSGGSSSDVSCVPLSSFRAYRFEAVGTTEVKESEDPALAESSDFPVPFRLVIESKGEAQGEERIQAVTRHGDGRAYQEGQTVAIGDTMWSLVGEQWVQNVRSPFPVPFAPLATCEAIAPDLKLAELSFTAEDVNGIASLHYQLEVPNEFYARHVNFSASGDEAQLIETLTVDVWIAEGANYPTKVVVEGTAEYPDGSELLSEIGYEIFDINATDIDISSPVNETDAG